MSAALMHWSIPDLPTLGTSVPGHVVNFTGFTHVLETNRMVKKIISLQLNNKLQTIQRQIPA